MQHELRSMYVYHAHLHVHMQQVKARGNVENWLGLVEDSMVISLRKLTKAALADFETKPRHIWATQHASQVHVHIHTLLKAVGGKKFRVSNAHSCPPMSKQMARSFL